MDEVQFRLIFYHKNLWRWSITWNIIHTFCTRFPLRSVSLTPKCNVGRHRRCCFTLQNRERARAHTHSAVYICLKLIRILYIVERNKFIWWWWKHRFWIYPYFICYEHKMWVYVWISLISNMLKRNANTI